MPASIPAARGAGLAPILVGIAVGLAAFVWLDHLNPPFVVTDDGVRDQLLARDCTDLGRCHLIGPATSLRGFHQGAVWLDLLIAVRLLGGGTPSQRAVVLALLALSVATLCVVVWRWLRSSLAVPAAVLLLGALSYEVSSSLLVNSSAAPFFDLLTAAGLLCYGLSGSKRFLVAAAFALGLAINVHAGSLILVAPLFAIAALASSHPWRALLASAATMLATYFFTSSAALRANVIGLAEHGRLLPALAAGLLIVVACAGLARRFRLLSWEARAWLVGGTLVLPYVLASLWLVFWQRHHFAVIYLHPVLAPAAALGAALICSPFEFLGRWGRALRWIPSVASIPAFAFLAANPAIVALPERAPPSGWTVPEVLAVTDVAVSRGWSYEDLVFHVQGDACRELLIGMSFVAPRPESAVPRGTRQLQVVKMAREDPALADRGGAVSLGPTAVAVARDVESWLRPEGLRACRIPIGSGAAPVCAGATPRAESAFSGERFLFVSRSYPEIHSLDLPPPYVATYEIPLAPAAGKSRELTLTEPGWRECVWHFTRVEGIRVEGGLPARHVRLHSDDGRPALLVIEKPFGTEACGPIDLDRRYPPCLLETPPGDPIQARARIF